MRNEVMKHKWLRSEKAKRDIGFDVALLEWTKQYRGIYLRNRDYEKES